MDYLFCIYCCDLSKIVDGVDPISANRAAEGLSFKIYLSNIHFPPAYWSVLVIRLDAKYLVMDSRISGLMHFLNYLDKAQSKARPWVEGSLLAMQVFDKQCIGKKEVKGK